MKAVNILFGSLIACGVSLLVFAKMNSIPKEEVAMDEDVESESNSSKKTSTKKDSSMPVIGVGQNVEAKSVNGINLREKPSTTSRIIKADFKGAIGNVVATSKQKDGVWLEVKLHNPTQATSMEKKVYTNVFVRSDVVKPYNLFEKAKDSVAKVFDVSTYTKF